MPPAQATAPSFSTARTGAADKTAAPKPSADELTKEVGEFVRQAVAESNRAVSLPWIAQQLPSRMGATVGSKWCGFGSFRALIDTLPLAPLAVSWDGGGHVWDPRRHTTPLRGTGEVAGGDWGKDGALADTARQIHDATGQPLLSPSEYAALFEAIAADVAAHPFQLTETGKRVRDRCRAGGESISRADVNFVLQGLVFSGHEFGKAQDTPALLARGCVQNVLGLCRREQMVIDDPTTLAINRWIASGVGSRERECS